MKALALMLAMLTPLLVSSTPGLAEVAGVPRLRRGPATLPRPARSIPIDHDAHLAAAASKRARKASRRLSEGAS